jgi:hypothetical protein
MKRVWIPVLLVAATGAVSAPSLAAAGRDSIHGSGTVTYAGGSSETFKIDATSVADAPLTARGTLTATGLVGTATAVVQCLNVVDANNAYVGVKETSGPNPGYEEVDHWKLNSPDTVTTYITNAPNCTNPATLPTTGSITGAVTSGGFTIVDR